jgi:hypothetical protein
MDLAHIPVFLKKRPMFLFVYSFFSVFSFTRKFARALLRTPTQKIKQSQHRTQPNRHFILRAIN